MKVCTLHFGCYFIAEMEEGKRQKKRGGGGVKVECVQIGVLKIESYIMNNLCGNDALFLYITKLLTFVPFDILLTICS